MGSRTQGIPGKVVSQAINYVLLKPNTPKHTDIFPERLTLTFSLDNNTACLKLVRNQVLSVPPEIILFLIRAHRTPVLERPLVKISPETP